jgi:hypothetical protein
VPKLVPEFVMIGARVDRDDRCAQAGAGEHGYDPRRRVGHVDRDAIARLDAELGERG